MSGCYLITGSADAKRTIPFKMGRIAAFETLILMSSVVMSIGCTIRVV
jgi:hypothetical protein